MPRTFAALRFAGALAAGLAATTAAPDADACGGCFVPPSQTSVVTGHRMVFAISPVQSVLWDQIQYSGDPAEFAWVLPVKKGAWIEASTDAWFEVLEAATKMTVQAPAVNCGSSGFGCSGFDSAGVASADSLGGGEPVKVVHEGTVGPYETVTLETSTQGVLVDWLKAHDYAVEAGIEPVIDAYVAEGFDFIALRLQPNAGIRQMKPVRIVTPGASTTLPLRMVAAGSAADVSIVLYVVGEGRWQTANFPSLSVPVDLLSWDFTTQTSNYAELRAATLGASGGRGWLTTYAQNNTFFDFVTTTTSFDSSRFSDLYVQQGIDNHEIDTPCQLPDLSGEGSPVIDPCPPNVPWNDPTCVGVPSGVDARDLVCGALDDLAVALTGMHPRDVWVTRLEASIPRKSLDADLVLEAASPQEQVLPRQVARLAENPESACPSATLPTPGQRATSSRGDSAALVVLGSAALLGALAALRRRRRFASA